MGLSTIEIAIIVGWAVRGLVLLAVGFLSKIPNGLSRPLGIAWLLLIVTFFGSVAEYNDLALPYARLVEVAVASFFVALQYSALFKQDPPSAWTGTLFLVGSNVLYAFATVCDDSQLEAGLIVIGGVLAICSMLCLRNICIHSLWFEWSMMVCAGLFYATVAAQTIFGPYVLAEWDRVAWTIIWEVAITLFYIVVAIAGFFWYARGTPSGEIPSDWWDMVEYVFVTNAWAEPKRKISD